MILNLFLNIFLNSQASTIIVDYVNGNKNDKYYEQVPQHQVIWGKIQALEPQYFPSKPYKGHGIIEPILNHMINILRRGGVNVYTDYFTPAKLGFYAQSNKYELCSVNVLPYKRYHQLYKSNPDSATISIPFFMLPKTGRFAIRTERLKDIEKYKFPNSTIYDIPSIVDDESLKTVRVENMQMFIGKQIQDQSGFILPKYKKRIYKFVASEATQLTLMLQGRRMDCAPRSSGKGNVVT